MGNHMWEKYKADIRQKMTIGSLAEHIWLHTLLKPIPKLRTEKNMSCGNERTKEGSVDL